MSDKLYSQAKLARVYYSAFSARCPAHHSKTCPRPKRFANSVSISPAFSCATTTGMSKNCPSCAHGNLPTNVDPKQAWADEHLLHQPVEVMTAEREQLLRIPGVGPVGANAIINVRVAAARSPS